MLKYYYIVRGKLTRQQLFYFLELLKVFQLRTLWASLFQQVSWQVSQWKFCLKLETLKFEC